MNIETNLIDNKNIQIIDIEPSYNSNQSTKLISADEILKTNYPPISWIVKKLLPEGLAMLAGRPKLGKSWMALGIAISVAHGIDAMGCFETNKSDVLYLALEDNFRRIKDRIRKILANQNFPLPNIYFLEENYNFPKLNENGIDIIEQMVDERKNIKLIIIDTFGRSISDKKRKDNSMYHGDYDLTAKIQKFAIERQICVLLIHHTRKDKTEYVFDEISGTTGITAGLDTMLVLKSNKNKCSLHVTGRDVFESEFALEWNPNTFSWEIKSNESTTDLTVEREEILELIKSNQEPMKTGKIALALNKSNANVSQMLGKMVDDGYLTRVKYGTFGLAELKKDPSDNGKESTTANIWRI